MTEDTRKQLIHLLLEKFVDSWVVVKCRGQEYSGHMRCEDGTFSVKELKFRRADVAQFHVWQHAEPTIVIVPVVEL